MKRRNVTIVLALCGLMVLFAGCAAETAGTATGGAVAGGLVANTFFGMKADLEKAREAKLAELKAAVAQLDAATTETEQAVAQARIKALEKTIQNLQDTQGGVALVEQGTQVDWTDPAAIGGYGGTVLAGLLAWYLRKKGKEETAAVTDDYLTTYRKYNAHKQGVERFMLEAGKTNGGADSSARLYDLIGDARVKNGVS